MSNETLYETIYIEINGESIEMEVHFRYTPAEIGNHEVESFDESYEFIELYIADKDGGDDIDMGCMLDLPKMQKYLIEQIKTKQ